MKSLYEVLKAQILSDGPITLADYMTQCLLHPKYGYYTTRDPLGAAGDFTTAPEISQMFGELIGLSLAQSWLDQGAPPEFLLAELGPGRGTLMADVLRATKSVPGFHDAARLHLVEASPTLKNLQAQQLGAYQPSWIENIEDFPDLPLFLLANEFFDALPIRQAVRTGTLWRERMIGLRGDTLQFGLSDAKPLPRLDHRLEDTKDGDVVEFSPIAEQVSHAVGSHIAQFGGTVLIIDYGDWRSQGDTFQALRGHASTDPLAEPGLADLTAHVDFEALTRATPSLFSRLTLQGVFLERLGITARAKALASNLSGDALQSHIAAHRRLTHPQEMGTLFKVIAFYPKGATPPPGLDP